MEGRDTQFAGFAKALLKEMLAQTQWDGMDFNSDDTEEVEKYSTIIAQRTYDLACHILSQIGGATGDLLEAEIITVQEVLASRPEIDMPTLPEVK